MSQHLESSRVAGLLMLEERDPERTRALAHAAQCAACQQELDEAGRSLALLDLLPALEPPSDLAISRARAALHAELASTDPRPERATNVRPVAARSVARWLPAAATVAAWGLTIAAARHRDLDRLPLSSLGAALAVAGAMLAVGGRKLLLLALGSVAVALSVATVGSDVAAVHASAKCAVVELVAAALPLGSMAWLAASARLPARGGGVGFAIAAAAGALAGQAGLQLTCPNHDAAHLMTMHVGAVALAAAVGAGLARMPRFRRIA